jgi:hypothetical protein
MAVMPTHELPAIDAASDGAAAFGAREHCLGFVVTA